MLVNDIWGAEVLKGGPAEWNTPIWEHDLDTGLRILRLAIDTHLITSHHLLPLLIDRPGGLLVEVTDGTTDYNASHYRISVFYDLAKVAVNRLAFSQGHELEPYGATAVAITPGWLRSEMMLEAFGVAEENWRDAPKAATARASRLGVAALRRPRRRRVGSGSRTGARWNQQSVDSGAARTRIRLHRRRRLAAGLVAVHRRRPSAASNPDPERLSLGDAARRAQSTRSSASTSWRKTRSWPAMAAGSPWVRHRMKPPSNVV